MQYYILSQYSRITHSARVVHRTSHSDVTSRGRPALGPYVSFPDVLYVPASVERHSYVRFGRDVGATSFLRPQRKRTSGKLTHGPKVGRPLNVHGRLAEWVLPFVKDETKWDTEPCFIYRLYIINVPNKIIGQYKYSFITHFIHIKIVTYFFTRGKNVELRGITQNVFTLGNISRIFENFQVFM